MTIAMSRQEAYLGFSHFPKIGPIKIKRLLKYFPDIAATFQAPAGGLIRAGLEEKLIAEFTVWRRSFCAPKIQEQLIKSQINFISWEEPDYPKILLETAFPPPSLYYRGSLGDFERKKPSSKNYNLAIVGSRRCSAYAEKIINQLLPPLVSAGLKIISGLAIGTDALAHRAALNNQGLTWAILGSGLQPNNIYPAINRSLAEEIVARGGALISEFPPDFPPLKQNFPQRNRLIAGLSAATIVIEAPKKSGSLITANYALEEGREVLAVPGNIFSELSIGTNSLIKAGAKLISCPEDILEIFDLATDYQTASPKIVPNKFYSDNPAEKIVYQVIRAATERCEKINPDEIIEKAKLDTALINSTLSILEIKGLIRQIGNHYELS